MDKQIICKVSGVIQARYRKIFLDNNIKIDKEAENWGVFIPDYEATILKQLKDLSSSNNEKVRYVMSVPGSIAFTRRKSVWINLVKFYGRTIASKIMPETFILDHAHDIDLMSLLYPNRPFILKTGAHRRTGLKIVKNAVEAINDKNEYQIAQLLLTDLYQINGISLNFRSYLLLTHQKGILTVYIYYDSICIYSLSQADDLNALITNSSNPAPKGEAYLMSDFCKLKQIDYSDFLIKLGKKVNELIMASASKLGKMENLSTYYCFEIFGLDVLIDKNKEPLICEINTYPSLIAKNKYSDTLKNDMLNSALSIIGLRKEENLSFIKTMETFVE